MLLIARLVVSTIILGLIAVFGLRAASRKKALSSVQPGLDALQAGFRQSRAPGETEPVCVVAFHYRLLGVVQVTVGVTDRRVLVVKGTGPVQSFAYDDEGEHLPAARKNAEKRGFFFWRHGPNGYAPRVHQPSPFTGEEWRMPRFVQGFPQQERSLKEFSRRFYFQWFYN